MSYMTFRSWSISHDFFLLKIIVFNQQLVVSYLRAAFIDPAVLSMFMLIFIFVIACSLFEWKWTCADFLSFINIYISVGDPISNYQEGERVSLISLTLISNFLIFFFTIVIINNRLKLTTFSFTRFFLNDIENITGSKLTIIKAQQALIYIILYYHASNKNI